MYLEVLGGESPGWGGQTLGSSHLAMGPSAAEPHSLSSPPPPQGCKERLDPFIPDPREWSALRVEDYGYARMQIVNMTHLWLEQVSDDQVGACSAWLRLPCMSGTAGPRVFGG